VRKLIQLKKGSGVFHIKTHVTISVYFAVLIACILILDHTGLAVFALFCALIHECGHLLALHIMHVQVEKVSLKIFGINITLSSGSTMSYRQETILALSGSTANFLTCVPTYILYILGIFPQQTGAIFAFSLVLGGFNLLPIGALDGGRALQALLCNKIGFGAAEKIVNILSVIFIIPITVAGVYIVGKTEYNISLIIAAVYLAASFILKDDFTKKVRKSDFTAIPQKNEKN
jgi:stage IV sporulation protein FB